jgi:glycosyltransferase involved in cell wall biosynthesis
VHNGVDDPGPWPDPARRAAARRRVAERVGPSPFVAVAVGRLVPDKGIDTVLQAFAAAGSSDGRLLVLGEGPARPALTDVARQLGVIARTVFAGWQDDVRAWLWGCDLLLHASRAEGLPNAVLEAMAAGLPVIATDAGGTAEAVAHGVTGYVVPLDDAASFARRLAELQAAPALRERFGAAGAERVRREFTVEAMTTGIREVMRSCR